MQTTVSDLIQILTQLNTGNPNAGNTAANAAPAAPVAAPASNVAPAAPAAPVAAPAPNVAPAAVVAANAAPAAPAAAPAPNVAPAAQAPFAAVFRCPSCDTVHFLGSVNAPAAVNAAAPAAPGAAPTGSNHAGPSNARNNQAGPSNTAGRWYSVTRGRQIGVFRDWYGVVDPLVNGVPDWRCKSFSTYAAAANHFNAHFAAGAAHVYTEPSVEAVDAADSE
ncbi:hypothetical protein EYR38_010596 [Pleurotus pulmonarius]|nr:hypothetical protein EYR38_010596 [Pleurotus pulmonarius]